MTVKETIEMYKGKYDIMEIYVGDRLYADSCDYYDPEQGMDYEAKSWALMNCEEYNNSILANTGVTTDNFGWKDEKILCVLISRESIAMGEEQGREAVKEKNMAKKMYYIEYNGDLGNGYVSYDNDIYDSLDMAMTFATEEEANAECEKLQKNWDSELKVACCSEN